MRALTCSCFLLLFLERFSFLSLLFSCSPILALFSLLCLLLHLSFYLKLSGRLDRNCLLSSPYYHATTGPQTFVSPGNDAADELARRGALVLPSVIHCSLSPLISRIHSSLFSDWRRTVSYKFFDTQFLSVFIEELVLHRHTRCVLSRLRCNGHSLLLSSYITRIGKIENSSCSTCEHSSQDTSDLIVRCPATDPLQRLLFGDSLCFYNLWSRPWKVVLL